MKKGMKILIGALAAFFMLCAAVSIPTAIGFTLYDWAVQDLALKTALWSGFILWLKMVVCFIPGAFLGAIYKEI